MFTLASRVCLHFSLSAGGRRRLESGGWTPGWGSLWRKEEVGVWRLDSRARPGMLACAEGSEGERLLLSDPS